MITWNSQSKSFTIYPGEREYQEKNEGGTSLRLRFIGQLTSTPYLLTVTFYQKVEPSQLSTM